MESRFRLRCAASATLSSPPPCGEVERGPFAAAVACSLAEEGFDSPVDFSYAGVSAAKPYAKAVGDLFSGLSVGTPYTVALTVHGHVRYPEGIFVTVRLYI